jgi:hypothetical protein
MVVNDLRFRILTHQPSNVPQLSPVPYRDAMFIDPELKIFQKLRRGEMCQRHLPAQYSAPTELIDSKWRTACYKHSAPTER